MYCTSEKKLSPQGLEFIPTFVKCSDQSDTFIFSFNLSKKDFDIYDDEPVCSFKGQASIIRDLQCSDSESEFDSCYDNANSST